MSEPVFKNKPIDNRAGIGFIVSFSDILKKRNKYFLEMKPYPGLPSRQ
jgi:hypothetical protein